MRRQIKLGSSEQSRLALRYDERPHPGLARSALREVLNSSSLVTWPNLDIVVRTELHAY